MAKAVVAAFGQLYPVLGCLRFKFTKRNLGTQICVLEAQALISELKTDAFALAGLDHVPAECFLRLLPPDVQDNDRLIYANGSLECRDWRTWRVALYALSKSTMLWTVQAK